MNEVSPDEIVAKLNGGSIQESDLSWLKTLDETRLSELKENDGIMNMRERWSNWILFFIGLILVFDILLIYFYGMGIWTFKDPRVVIVVITDNFLKIFGLGFLITREIFKKIYLGKS
jgi:hypothetical protein